MTTVEKLRQLLTECLACQRLPVKLRDRIGEALSAKSGRKRADREAISRLYAQGLTYDEVAKRLGIGVATVGNALRDVRESVNPS